MIYFDHASTSYPKPQSVQTKICEYLDKFGVSPNRGAHQLTRSAQELVDRTRERLAGLLGVSKTSNLAFTMNATHSLNIAIKGSLNEGNHALYCSNSHNSVIRPIETLKRSGLIEADVFSVEVSGNIDLDALRNKIKKNTRLLMLTHVSNVTGAACSLQKIAELCSEYKILFLLDCTQSLGYLPLQMNHLPIDILAGTGHKTLLGPPGIGFLYVKNPKEVRGLMEGGSGGNLSISPYHPSQSPEKYEAGTLHTVNIAGLSGALDYLGEQGFERLAARAMELHDKLYTKLAEIEEIVLHGPSLHEKQAPILSFNLRGHLPSEVGYLYDHQHGICVRTGIHCAPPIHEQLGTLPTGSIRVSLSHSNTEEEIDYFIAATKMIAHGELNAKTC